MATGWTVNRSVKNKAATWVNEAIDYAGARFPFPILGIDSDNGSEFISVHLYDYCAQRRITFTRARPGNKHDGAHVEQKNWTHVRELVGCLRYDTEAELEVLNRIWETRGERVDRGTARARVDGKPAEELLRPGGAAADWGEVTR